MEAHRYIHSQRWQDTVKVLGTRLKPLSLGHAMLLQRLGLTYGFPETFWNNGELKGPKVGDLVLSVGICGRNFVQAERFAMSRWLGLWAKWRCAVYEIKYAPVIEIHHFAMCRYVLEAWTSPPIIPIHDSKYEPGAPLLGAIKCALTSKLGCSEFEALNRPLVSALWDYGILLEMEGAARLQNKTEDSLVEAAIKMAEAEAERIKSEDGGSGSKVDAGGQK